MKHRHEMCKKAKGGSVEPKGEKSKANEYNAKGSPEEKEAKDEKDSFKRGGHAHGHKQAKRLDKRARGGRMEGGKSPFTEAHRASDPPGKSSGPSSGHEDEQPGDSP